MKQTKLLFFLLFLFFINSVSAIDVTFENPTPSNGSTISSRNFIINTTINSDNPLSSIIYNWNNTNYSIYDDSLVLYYNFDNRSSQGENDTNIKSIDKYFQNATVIGGSNISWRNNGKYYGAFNFTGDVGYINTSNSQRLNTSKPYSLSVWINYRDGSSLRGIMDSRTSGNNFLLAIGGTANQIRFSIFNATAGVSLDQNGVLTSNRWYHIVAINNGTSQSIYIDGNLSRTAVSNIGIANNNPNNIRVGTDSLNIARYWNGSIDEVMVFNRSLNEDEIRNLYRTSLTKINNTYFNLYVNQTNLSIYNTKFGVFVNDSLQNVNQSNFFIRFLNIINISTILKGVVRSDFYGVNTHGTFGSNFTWIDTNNDGIYDTMSNYTWHRDYLTASKISSYRADMKLNRVSINESLFNFTALNTTQTNMLTPLNTVFLARLTGRKVMFIADTTPLWLANTTDGLCNSTALYSCQPTNYTKFGYLVVNFLKNVTCDETVCELEVWNEPYSSTLLNNVSYDKVNKSIVYNQIYNATRNAVKTAFPNMAVGGPSGFRDAPNLTRNFLGNFTTNMDFVSIHPYGYDNINNFEQLNDTNNLFTLCNSYGANCSRIALTEWNVGSYDLQNLTFGVKAYSQSLSSSYSSLINNYPANLSNYIYQWSDYVNYSGSGYIWYMVSETALDNRIMPSYNVTYDFTRYAPATGSVYTSTSEYSPYKIVATTIGTTQNLIVTNTENDEGNVTINCEGNYRTSYIDLSSGQLYDCSSGQVNLGVFNEYDVRYFTEFTNVFYNSDWYFGNYLDEPIRLMTAEEIAQYLTGQDLQEGTCIDMIQIVGGWIPLIGLIGTVVFLGAIMLVLGGFAMFKAPNIDSQSIVGGIVVVIFTGLLVIVSIVIFSNLCF